MLLTSQNRGNKNIRFMSLGKRKIGTFSAAVWRQPSCFSCLSICLPAALNSHRLYAFLFFLSICFPVCQSLCLSLFSHVYLFLTSLFLSVKSIWISLPALSEMHPHRAVFFFLPFSKRNLESIPDVSAWIQAGEASVYRTRWNRISGPSFRRVSARKKAGSWVSLPSKSSVSKYTWR